MVDTRRSQRRPGNRVVRRRLGATQVIPLRDTPLRREIPNVRTHAKRFVAGYTAIVVLGAFLLMLPWAAENREPTAPIDALFTAVSASAVTGLVTVDTATHWSFFGELVILVLIQLGGLGFMVGASLVLLSLRRGATLRDTLLLRDGAPTLSPKEAQDLSWHILRFTLLCEAVGAVVLSLRFMADRPAPEAIWHGIFHSISAFCNAGFDLQGAFASLAGYRESWVVLATVMALIQAGALSYIVLSDVWRTRRWRPLLLDTKLVLLTNAALIVIAAAVFLVLEWQAAMTAHPDAVKPLNALFQSVAARTAGYATISFDDAHPATLFLWVAVMLVGGAAGSTAGGIKLATLAILVLAVLATLRGHAEPQAFGRRVPSAIIFRAMAIVAIFLAAHFLFTLGLALTEDVLSNNDIGFAALMFEAMSALATVGLSTGITPELSAPGKLLLCAAMFLGRIGPLTAAYALQRKQQQQVKYRFPEASIRIG